MPLCERSATVLPPRSSEAFRDVSASSASVVASSSAPKLSLASLGRTQKAARSPSHGSTSRSKSKSSPVSANASPISLRISASGSSVRRTLPAASSASSRSDPSGRTTSSA